MTDSIEKLLADNHLTLEIEWSRGRPDLEAWEEGEPGIKPIRRFHYLVTLTRQTKPAKRFEFWFTVGEGIIAQWDARGLGLDKAAPRYKPPLVDVLECLVSDADTCFHTFEQWCEDYGWNADSRKVERIYQASHKYGLRLMAAFGVNPFDRTDFEQFAARVAALRGQS